MKATPLPEHDWLQKLVGEWTTEANANMGPDKPAEKFNGTDSVRAIGSVWVQCEGRGQTPDGGTAVTMMTLGYDPAKKKYLGTFIGSMMTFMWVYEGELDGNKLTLNTTGPDFAVEGKMCAYRDVIEFITNDHRTLTSFMQGPDGAWTTFMTAHYRRKE